MGVGIGDGVVVEGIGDKVSVAKDVEVGAMGVVVVVGGGVVQDAINKIIRQKSSVFLDIISSHIFLLFRMKLDRVLQIIPFQESLACPFKFRLQ